MVTTILHLTVTVPLTSHRHGSPAQSCVSGMLAFPVPGVPLCAALPPVSAGITYPFQPSGGLRSRSQAYLFPKTGEPSAPPPYTQPTPATRGQAWSYHGQAFSPLWFFFLKVCASPVPSKVQTPSPHSPTHTRTTHTHMHTRSTHTSSSDEEMRSSYPDPGSTAAPGRSVAALCGWLPQGHKQALLSPDSSPGPEAQSTFCFPHLCSAFGLKGCEAALDPHSYQFPDVSTVS